MEWFNILRKISEDEMYQELGLEVPRVTQQRNASLSSANQKRILEATKAKKKAFNENIKNIRRQQEENKKAEEQRIANQKAAQETSDASSREFQRQKNIEAGKKLPTAPTLPKPYSNVPEMVNLPESEEMKTNKVNAMNRIMEQTGSNYKVEGATPENLKRNWQKQLQRKQQEKEKLELQRRANKEKKRENRAAKKLQRTERRNAKALRREEKGRIKQLRDDKASGLTDAGRRFLDNQQRVANKKPNVTTVGVAPKS